MNELTLARLHAGLSVSEACALLGRSVRTWRHWKRHGAPDWALRVLAIYAGDLSLLGWHGWRIQGGVLYAPDLRYGWTPEQLYAEWWNRQRLNALDRKAREEPRNIKGSTPSLFPRAGRDFRCTLEDRQDPPSANRL